MRRNPTGASVANVIPPHYSPGIMRLPFPALLSLALLASGFTPAHAGTSNKKKDVLSVRIHGEGGAEEGEKFTVPVVLIDGRRAALSIMPLLSEHDIKSVYPFRAAVGSFGIYLRLDPHGANLLTQYSLERMGQRPSGHRCHRRQTGPGRALLYSPGPDHDRGGALRERLPRHGSGEFQIAEKEEPQVHAEQHHAAAQGCRSQGGVDAGPSRPVTMSSKPSLRSGWILVVGLIGLCVLGTWLTSRNYRAQVLTSTRATVLENMWPESRISAQFAAGEASRMRPGMAARITVGNDKTLIPGRIFSVGTDTNAATVMISVTGDVGNAGRPAGEPGKPHHYLPAGAECAVTIDMTIPREALASPSPR